MDKQPEKKSDGIKRVEFYSDRWYRIGETYYPSVTTILGVLNRPGLTRFRGDVGNREADMRMFEAGERGTRIHSGLETLAKGGTVILNPPQHPNYSQDEINAIPFVNVMRYQDEYLQVMKLKQFFDIVKPEIEAVEITVYAHSHKYAGTVDLMLRIKDGSYAVNGRTPLKIPGGRYCCDLKSGKIIDRSAYKQTAAYARAYEEMEMGKVDGTIILWTGSSNRSGIEGLGVQLRTDKVDNDYVGFLRAQEEWLEDNEGKQPKMFDFPIMMSLVEK